MLSTQELDYLRSLINTYKKQGYIYYLLTTNSDSSINSDFYLFLSKDIIQAVDDKTFIIKNGIRIDIDNNFRYNEQPDVLTIRNSISNNVYIVNKYEYVYSNCNYSYDITEAVIYPDLLFSGSDSYNSFYIITFLLISIFLYMFIKSVLRIRR